jgi:hypothetical protein
MMDTPDEIFHFIGIIQRVEQTLTNIAGIAALMAESAELDMHRAGSALQALLTPLCTVVDDLEALCGTEMRALIARKPELARVFGERLPVAPSPAAPEPAAV